MEEDVSGALGLVSKRKAGISVDRFRGSKAIKEKQQALGLR